MDESQSEIHALLQAIQDNDSGLGYQRSIDQSSLPFAQPGGPSRGRTSNEHTSHSGEDTQSHLLHRRPLYESQIMGTSTHNVPLQRDLASADNGMA